MIIVGAIARSIINDWDKVRNSGAEFRIDPLWLLLSLLVVWGMWALLIEGWRRLVVGWGEPLRWPLAGRIWMLSSFGKYIPGKVWAMAGMVAMSERHGVSGKVALASAIVMQALGVGAGLAVAAVTIGPLIRDWNENAGTAMLLLGAAVAGLLIAVGSRPVIDGLWKVARREGPAPAPPEPAVLTFAIVTNLASWVVYGAALVFLSRGILPGAELGWQMAVGCFTFAYLAGYLAPFAPGGLGVRDLVLAWLLRDAVGLAPALALAAASRLAFTLNEVGAAAPFLFMRETASDDT